MNKPSILYITRNGMLEPLGQSQVLSYLRGLSADYRITLISFEKTEDIINTAEVEKVRKDCDDHNIRWLPQRFHYKPKLIAPLWSMIIFLFLCLREVSRGNANIIHARSYIPASVALLVNYLKGTPFIFDMRALWPEELITAGRINRHSFMHKILVWIERQCLHKAATVISLTNAAVDYLKKEYKEELKGQQLVVISTCTDLNRFIPKNKIKNHPRIYSCIGTVLSGWFRIELLAKCFQDLSRRDPDAQFEIITRDNAQMVRKAIGGDDNLQSRLEICSLPSGKVHEAIQRHTASIMFFKEGLGKLGSAPTRMGEILGCGLPVIANAGVGDVARIIEHYRVGVLVKENSDEAVQRALEELDILMKDPHLAQRCRNAAEEVFSLQKGTEAYRTVYKYILNIETVNKTV